MQHWQSRFRHTQVNIAYLTEDVLLVRIKNHIVALQYYESHPYLSRKHPVLTSAASLTTRDPFVGAITR